MRSCSYMLLVLLACDASAQSVSVRDEKLTLPTYPMFAGDRNHRFYAYDGSILYPYNMQDDPGHEREDRTYDTVVIENEYLKAICIPAIGGRIHSVLDKTTNEEMFFRNDVIKPGLIAMRGAWISGGIEWNRGPQGHTVTSFAPVNVVKQTHADGSASIFIAYMEYNFRTRWSVKFTLHPGKAYLHETIRLENPNDGVYSYYFWNNTAFPCKPGTRFIFPMTLGQDHNGVSFFSWPVHNGKDLTWLKNYDEPTALFAYDCAFDFFGAYDIDDDRGIVQYGDHRVLTGKKAWTWGQSGDGIASQRALHDDDAQYIEVQSGPLETQADFGLLGPHEHLSWEEWWYPVHGLGDGFEYATRDVAIQTGRDEAGIAVRVLATSVFSDSIVSVRSVSAQAGGGVIDTVNLSPAAPVVVRAKAAPEEIVAIEVRASDGKVLASYQSPLAIPQRTAPAPPQVLAADASIEQIYLAGVKHEERIEPGPARAAYERCIAIDNNYTDARVALARIDLGRARYVDAIAHARAALERDPNCGMAWYYLGCALLELPESERDADPVDIAYKAVGTIENAALGHDLAGRAHMRARRYAEALPEFQRAVFKNPGDIAARENYMTALYANDKLGEARQFARATLESDPLNLVARAIVGLDRPSDLFEFGSFMRGRLGSVETAIYFGKMGLPVDGLRLLEEVYSEPFPNTVGVLYQGNFTDMRLRATQWYVLAWLAHLVGDVERSHGFLSQGKAVDAEYGAHADPIYLDILNHAIAVNPDDANALLFRGNLYAHFGDLTRAVADWEASAALPKASSMVVRNLAMHAWKKDGDQAKSTALYQRAIELRPDDQGLYREAAEMLVEFGRREDAIALIENMPADRRRRSDTTVILANAYNEEKRFDDCIALLENERFSNWELSTGPWQAFHRARIERGKLRFGEKDFAGALEDFSASLTYPENLGVGRAARPAESEGLYWKGKALEALGRDEEAKAAWREGANGVESSERQTEFVNRCQEAIR